MDIIKFMRSRSRLKRIIVIALTIAVTMILMIPIIWMINSSVRPVKEILAFPPQVIPDQVSFKYFARILSKGKYQGFILNSLIITVSTIFLTLTLSLLASYGLSRFQIKGRNGIMLFIMALLMLPPIILVVPFFKFSNLLRIYDTVFVLIICNTTFVLPLSVWLMKSYIDAIPVAVEEAAMLDGCNRFQVLVRILLPAVTPGLVGTATFIIVTVWNEYLLALTLTDTPDVQPLTIGLAAFFGQYVRDWNSIMALATISSLPVMLLFIFFQRWVVKGLTAGSVK